MPTATNQTDRRDPPAGRPEPTKLPRPGRSKEDSEPADGISRRVLRASDPGDVVA